MKMLHFSHDMPSPYHGSAVRFIDLQITASKNKKQIYEYNENKQFSINRRK